MTSQKSKRTVLLTMGRLPVALELARALHKANWRVLVADPYAWHLGRLSNTVSRSFKVTAPVIDAECYLDELQAIVVQEEVELVLPVSEETLYVSALKARLPEHVVLFCTDQNSLLTLHDKYAFAVLAKNLSVPVPDTARADNKAQCADLIKQPYVLKPRFSCSGTGVRFGRADSPLEANEQTPVNILQQCLHGESCSSFSIAHNGIVLYSLCYRSLLESGSVAVCFERIELPAIVQSTIQTIARATHYTGMISFDFIQDDEGTWRTIECNPRATSGIHFIEHRSIEALVIQAETLHVQSNYGRRQEFWSCLMTVEGALFRGKLLRRGWAQLFATKDITLCRTDLKPFLFLNLIMAPQLIKSIYSGTSISEVLMSDISWRSE